MEHFTDHIAKFISYSILASCIWLIWRKCDSLYLSSNCMIDSNTFKLFFFSRDTKDSSKQLLPQHLGNLIFKRNAWSWCIRFTIWAAAHERLKQLPVTSAHSHLFQQKSFLVAAYVGCLHCSPKTRMLSSFSA